MKRVLVIATFFPPAGGIAPTRIASFVRHLPACGWEPAVVTVDWHRGNRKWIDESQNDESLQENVIFRAPQPDLRRRSGVHVPPLLSWGALRMDPIAVAQQVGDRLRFGEASIGSRFFVRAASRFLRSHLRTQRYDAILATSPDLNPQAIASEMGARFGIPWVADCRDDYAVYREGKPRYVEVERELLASAAAGLDGVARSRGGDRKNGSDARSRLSRTASSRTRAAGRSSRPSKRTPSTSPTPGRSSTYYPGRHNPATVLEALDLFLARHPGAEGRIALHFFGDTALQPILDEFTTRFPRLKGVLRDRGRVERADALAAQRSADLLLILAHPGRKGILTGKVFEYLAARRPILCVPGDGGRTGCPPLRRTKAGAVLPSAQEGAAYLAEAFASWERSGSVPYECDENEVARYSRFRLTDRLAKILDHVATQKASPARG